MHAYVLGFEAIDKSQVMLAGGKGANLGELSRLEGIHVPPGFCLATQAFTRIKAQTPAIDALLDRLAQLPLGARDAIRDLSAELRAVVAAAPIPPDMREEITHSLARLGAGDAYAIRSSATAEDSPAASFAGQGDTYLNVVGEKAILAHIGKCWASLFTERAIIYRLQQGFDHRQAHVAVVVQKMVFPEAAGILFTADPLSGNRTVTSIDASFGLGEALVGGLVTPDTYQVRNGEIRARRLGSKQVAIYALAEGGTHTVGIAPPQQNRQVLADAQILMLARLGKAIEAHFGCPQDIEWCLAGATFYIVQSRPITTLFPIPQAGDQAHRVYVSVGHQQMMTDAMKPLGLSFFLLTTRAPMRTAGGRLFVDITAQLATPGGRQALMAGLGKSEPLIKDALATIMARGDFPQEPPQARREASAPGPAAGSATGSATGSTAGSATGSTAGSAAGSATGNAAGSTARGPQEPGQPDDLDPRSVDEWIQRNQASVTALQQAIQTQTGVALFDFIQQDIEELRKFLFDPQSMRMIMAALDAAAWLNDKLEAWLGAKNAADTLVQSAPNNITAEMGLALLDVADVIRPFPQVIAYLQQPHGDDFLAGLQPLAGGQASRAALETFLDRYGMRCSGEIDITRPRWREQPLALVPMILSNIKNFAPGAGRRRFVQGREEALQQAAALLARVAQLPGGAEKAQETKRQIDRLRNFMGYREYPKYGMVSRYFIYKQALRRAAAQLVKAGVLRAAEDSDYLTFDELRAAVATQQVDGGVIVARQEEHRWHAKLTPPRVLTSEGEAVRGVYRREDLPPGALAGLAVSAGTVEGRARVILRMEDAVLAAGDILVTAYTDPSWTPLFVAIRGLVTEVGGLMTHGAVIAREYGLPAVVAVEGATQRIKDGQRIRVHGTEGYVEIL